jgi:hypothetical protein
MGELQDFVAELLERQGAAVETLDAGGLEVLVPQPLQETLGFAELAQLSFGANRPGHAIPIGLEGDWLDRFGALLGEHGRWAERQLTLADAPEAPGNPERVLDRALDLPNAVWRFQGMTAAVARCLMLAFRYSALSDEKREGLVWVGFNLSTGAVLDEVMAAMRPVLAREQWQAPDAATRLEAGPRWEPDVLQSRVRGLLERRIRLELEPFLRATRRRLERDQNRVHEYHEDLRGTSMKRLAALAGAQGEKPEADRRREQLRVSAIEREYQAKLDDLRHHYAIRVVVEWAQALELYLPVQRFDVLIRRRRGERSIRLDWHPLVRTAEPAPCDWGLGMERTRLVCDDKLHLTDPAGQAPCLSCAKAWCRACHPARCPRCGSATKRGASQGGRAPATEQKII